VGRGESSVVAKGVAADDPGVGVEHGVVGGKRVDPGGFGMECGALLAGAKVLGVRAKSVGLEGEVADTKRSDQRAGRWGFGGMAALVTVGSDGHAAT
jgi:hypothetical protein